MTSSVIQLYEQLTSAPDDKARARIIAEAFERMEERYPEVKDLATQSGLQETELRLLKEIEIVRKEIEVVRKEIAEVEGRLAKEIAEVEGRLAREIAEVEGRLAKEIAEVEGRVRKEIEVVRKEIEHSRASTLRWVVGLLAGQTVVILAALFAIVT